MTKRVLLAGAAAVLLGGCSAGTSSERVQGLVHAPAMATTDNVPQRLLATHNSARIAAGVPPLRWDPQLAAGAQTYAAQLAQTGQLVHSPRQSRPGQGENLWMGTAGAYSPEFMVQSWADERRLFRPGTFPNVSATRNWADVAHYTQMIWRSTTSVGCAIQRSGRRDVLVCRYSPAGNRDGVAVP
jgi:hypothetical protein